MIIYTLGINMLSHRKRKEQQQVDLSESSLGPLFGNVTKLDLTYKNTLKDIRRKRLEKRDNLLSEYYNKFNELSSIQPKVCSSLRSLSPETNVAEISGFIFKRHPNGGGWVQNTSNVDSSILLPSNVIVMGNVVVLPTTHVGENATIGFLGMRKRVYMRGNIF